MFRNSSWGSLHTTPFQYPMKPELRHTTKTKIPFLPSILHFLSAETRYFVGNHETLALITVLKIRWYSEGLTLWYIWRLFGVMGSWHNLAEEQNLYINYEYDRWRTCQFVLIRKVFFVKNKGWLAGLVQEIEATGNGLLVLLTHGLISKLLFFNFVASIYFFFLSIQKIRAKLRNVLSTLNAR